MSEFQEVGWSEDRASSFHRTSSCASLVLEPLEVPPPMSADNVDNETTTPLDQSGRRRSSAALRQAQIIRFDRLNHSFLFRLLELAAEWKVRVFVVGRTLVRVIAAAPRNAVRQIRRVAGRAACTVFYVGTTCGRLPLNIAHSLVRPREDVPTTNVAGMGLVPDLSEFYFEKMYVMEFQVAQMKEDLAMMTQAMSNLERKLLTVEEENELLMRKVGQLTAESANQSECEDDNQGEVEEVADDQEPEQHEEDEEQDEDDLESELHAMLDPDHAAVIDELTRYAMITELREVWSQRRLRRPSIPRTPGRTPLRTARKSHSALSESILRALDSKFLYVESPPTSPSNTSDSFRSPRAVSQPVGPILSVKVRGVVGSYDNQRDTSAQKLMSKQNDALDAGNQSNEVAVDDTMEQHDFLALALQRAKQRLQPVQNKGSVST